jgi:hypothetical protein
VEEEHAALDDELASVHAAIAQHHAAGHGRPRKGTGSFGALAGTGDLTAAAAHASAASAPSLSAVPERGGAFRRPRKAT